MKIYPDIFGAIRDESSNGVVRSVGLSTPAPVTGRLHFTPKSCVERIAGFQGMFRFGAEFHSGGQLVGALYGYVFQHRRGGRAPGPEDFYAWCDSHSEESAATGRAILDAGVFPRLFAAGHALIVDSFEFAPAVAPEVSGQLLQSAVRAVTKQPRFRALAQAVVLITGCDGEPGDLAYRRSFERAFATAQQAELGGLWKGSAPSPDIFLNIGPHLDNEGQIEELVKRTGLEQLPQYRHRR